MGTVVPGKWDAHPGAAAGCHRRGSARVGAGPGHHNPGVPVPSSCIWEQPQDVEVLQCVLPRGTGGGMLFLAVRR